MHTPALELRYDQRAATFGFAVAMFTALTGNIALLNLSDTLIGLVVSVAFMGIGAIGALECWRRSHDRAIVLSIGPDGIRDRRLGPRLIAWDQIVAIEARTAWGRDRQRYLDLHVLKSAPVSPSWHTALYRLIGARGFPVTEDGLDGSFNQILLAASHFAGARSVPMKL